MFPDPYANMYVRIQMNHPEGNSVSGSINTLEGQKKVNLSGGGIAWERAVIFWIEDVSAEGFVLAYEINIKNGETVVKAQSEKEIGFENPSYTIDLGSGFNFTIRLEVAPEEAIKQ